MTSDGKPLVHRMILDVLPNPLVVVPGNHQTTVVFCISGECKVWTDALPPDMQEVLRRDNAAPVPALEEQAMQLGLMKSNLSKFPYFPVGRLYYSALVAGLISQIASYQIFQSAEEFEL